MIEVKRELPDSIFQDIESQDLKKVDQYLDTSNSQEREKIISHIEDVGIQLPLSAVRGLDEDQHRRLQRMLNAKLEKLAAEINIPLSASSKEYVNEGRETILEHESAHIKKAEDFCGATWEDAFIFIFATTDRKGEHLDFGAMTSGFSTMPGYESLTRSQELLIDLAPREPAVSDYLFFCEGFQADNREINETELAEIIRILESKPQSIGRDASLSLVSRYNHL